MNAPLRAFEAPEPLLRWPALTSILRKDMQQLGSHALTTAIGMFLVSALLHTSEDFSALLPGVHVPKVAVGLVVALVAFAVFMFVARLAQTNGASDASQDMLIRPVYPLELVVSRLVAIFVVIVAPMIVGDFVYMALKGAPLAQAFSSFMGILDLCVLVLVVSWMASTPFRAIRGLVDLAIAGLMGGLLAMVIRRIAKSAFGISNVTPFPDLVGSWMFVAADSICLYTASGITLWFLLARRNLITARRVYLGYFGVSTFLQLLFLLAI